MTYGRRFHNSGDGWGRGSYAIPSGAIVGSSDCGMWSDSPAPSDKVREELQRFRKECLKPLGITSRFGKPTTGGNVFMSKVWVVVGKPDFERAAQATADWLAEHGDTTRYIHDADLKEIGVVAGGGAK